MRRLVNRATLYPLGLAICTANSLEEGALVCCAIGFLYRVLLYKGTLLYNRAIATALEEVNFCIFFKKISYRSLASLVCNR